MIEEFCKSQDLGNVKNITKLTGGLMHKMFKVETDKGIYCIKILNPEVMQRKEAYDNFVISEKISNLAKENNIPVSNALNINNNFINKFKEEYYMVFDFVDGKTLQDNEITIDHCKKIGKILSQIHSLDYKSINLKENKKEYNNIINFSDYINNPKFNSMSYKDKFLDNYKKYESLQKRANERLNDANDYYAVCHRDLDPKNVMWNNDSPIVIDWESANISNPYLELVETALCWSGFLSNNFDSNKFKAVIEEYIKIKPFEHNRYNIICGGLINRFKWLKYNLDRSLGIITDDKEEVKLATKEVEKTIDEINRYQELIGVMYDIICDMTKQENHTYDEYIQKIINSNDLLKGLTYEKINAGFTNTIYKVGNYIIRICTDEKNEPRFKNEIDFYNKNKDNDKIPKLYYYDLSKDVVPYYYEITEYIKGETLYQIWYKLNNEEKKEIIIKIIEILKTFHSKKVNEYDYKEFIKNKIKELSINDDSIIKLLDLCDKYFEENKFGIVHADLHFDNFIYNNGILKLIDFERYVEAPIDYDFRIFYQCEEEPWLWASGETDMLTVESDYEGFMQMFIDNYDELKNIKYLKERLEVYKIIDILQKYKHSNNEIYLQKVKRMINELK